MALNYSHKHIFSGDDNLVAPMSASRYHFERTEKVVDRFGYARDMSDNCCSQDPAHDDIIKLLPSDPFGMDMDISTSFAAAFMGLFEDFEVSYGGYNRDQGATSDGYYPLFAGMNFVWNNSMRFQETVNMNSGSRFCTVPGVAVDGSSVLRELGSNAFVHDCVESACKMENLSSLRDDVRDNEINTDFYMGMGDVEDGIGFCSGGDGESPHSAFNFALAYLSVKDLLVVETVSKSLCYTIQNEPLLWRNIHIDQPLNEKLTDETLLQITSRAVGELQCLSLVECPRITDDGLKHVLENNPKLTKLSVPGCSRLSIEGIVTSLKSFKASAAHGVKHLRVGGLYGMTQKHYEDLKKLLDTGVQRQNAHTPHLYRRGNLYLSCEDDRAIDVEMCPRCDNLRLVYDCPMEGCQGIEHPTRVCRACTLCISRCALCGRCIIDGAFEETFCLELLCTVCWETTKWQESVNEEGDPSNCPAYNHNSTG